MFYIRFGEKRQRKGDGRENREKVTDLFSSTQGQKRLSASSVKAAFSAFWFDF